MKYLVIVEKGERTWGAHVPDLPGCVAAAESRAEVVKLIREAIEFHIEGLRDGGSPYRLPARRASSSIRQFTLALRACRWHAG